MKICVYGAGAIGGHVAARLAAKGADVSLIARGAHLRAIQQNGLTVHAPDGRLHSRPRATDNPAELGPQDAVLVTVKAPALGSVAADIAPLLRADTSVAFIMNGIPWWYFDRHGGPLDGKRIPALDPGDAIRNAVGVHRTLGGVVYAAATVTAPGEVLVEAKDARVTLGELDHSHSSRVRALAEMLSHGIMTGEASDNIRRAVWMKLLGNLMTGPLCCLTRSSMRETLANPAVRAAAVRAAEEIDAIASAYGHPLGGAAEPRIARSAGLDHKPSILQDLELGRPMEVEALWVAPLRLAREASVAVPTLELTTQLAAQQARAARLYVPFGES
jgi:2-dehydropantoate 2-reductase